jgi:OOP family OmpA-OmpF porin
MTNARTLAAIVAGLMVVGGCGISSEVDALKKMPPKGDAFMHALQLEYAALAGKADARGSDDSAEFYYQKGLTAAQGKKVDPLAMKDRKLPKGVDDEVEAARLALVAVLRGGSIKKAPKDTALAQATFDCWMEEASRGAPAAVIKECRDSFDKALKISDAAMHK